LQKPLFEGFKSCCAFKLNFLLEFQEFFRFFSELVTLVDELRVFYVNKVNVTVQSTLVLLQLLNLQDVLVFDVLCYGDILNAIKKFAELLFKHLVANFKELFVMFVHVNVILQHIVR